jgi:tetratricopeptide (TPR) repeat protein
VHVALGYERWAKTPQWSETAQYEAARAWFKSGDRKRAREGFIAWHESLVKQGRLPPIDQDFHMALADYMVGGEGQVPVPPDARTYITSVMESAAREFIAQGQPATAVMLSWQATQLGLGPLGDSIMNQALASLPADGGLGTKLTAASVMWHGSNFERADALVTPLLEEKVFADSASLWRFAADLAEKRGRLAEAVARRERVADIEFARLPKEYEVSAARAPFAELLPSYEKLAAALASAEQKASPDLVARIVRAVDRWRTVDGDPTEACLAAARVLSTLGQGELAWDYATTPIATRGADATPYWTLAKQLADQGPVELADRAFSAAAKAAPTNATIAWEHAQMLEKRGQYAQARKLFERLAKESWPDEYRSIKEQAAQRVGGK